MRTLFLHIGTHKTGTTSLQAYLRDHRQRLQAAGVSVLTERHRKFGETTNCLGFAHGILRDEVQTVARMTGDMPGSGSIKAFTFRRHVRQALKRLPAQSKAILSAEALCFARTDGEADRLAAVFDGLGLTVIPVLCLRKEADWRASWNAELRDWSARMTGAFGTGTGDIRGDWYFDRHGIEAFWQKVGPLRGVDFDAAVSTHGSVLPELLSALDLTADGDLSAYKLRQRQG